MGCDCMNTRPEYLLVAQKSETERRLLVAQLEKLDYLIAVAEDGRQALEMLRLSKAADAEPPQFVLAIFEVGMLEAEDYRILQELKADAALCDLPVLVTGTIDNAAQIARCLERGVDDYIFARQPPAFLKTRISACLAKMRLDNQAQAHPGLSANLERDLEIGRQIQSQFLPNRNKLPRFAGWDIAARLHPARSVAGDFYDVFSVGRNKIGLFIGDVCDKGVGPAMFMALIRSLLRAFAEQHRPLGWMDELTSGPFDSSDAAKETRFKRQKILMSSGASALLAVELTNNYVSENHGEMNMFATLFFGVLDRSSGVLTYVNGGHDVPIIVGADGAVKAELMPTGPAIGIIPGAAYDIEQVTLERGDLLLTYTDGVTEAMDQRQNEWGVLNLVKTIQLSALDGEGQKVQGLVETVQQKLLQFTGDVPQYDDMTLVALRILK
jgi:sigma-B regulation protein RsbU (phosphoserine phosphatase)